MLQVTDRGCVCVRYDEIGLTAVRGPVQRKRDRPRHRYIRPRQQVLGAALARNSAGRRGRRRGTRARRFALAAESGRATGRERVSQEVWIQGDAISSKKKQQTT